MTSEPLKSAVDETLVELVLQRIRSELKISEVRTKAHEAEIAQLKKTLEERDQRIAELMKVLMGPTSERRSWASLSPADQLFLEGMGLVFDAHPGCGIQRKRSAAGTFAEHGG